MLPYDTANPLTVPMCTLKSGEAGTVRSITITGSLKRRLQDLGVIPGTKVCCVGISPMGDPHAYRIRGAVIALRDDDCREILVER